MSDYQPIYDAACRKIGSVDGRAVVDAIASMFQDAAYQSSCAAQEVSAQMTRPSVLYRPSLAPDGTMWSALLGENIAEGVCGFGETPEAAMADFDRAWFAARTPHAMMLAAKGSAE